MTVYNPTTGAQLSSAISSCTFGDTIELQAGLTYLIPAFGLTLGDKGVGTDWITITTDDLDALPAKLLEYPNNYRFADETNYRITTAEAAAMPKLKTTDGYPIFFWGHAAHHWKLIGIEFTNYDPTNTINVACLVQDIGGQADFDDLPRDNWVEKCFFHPKEEVGYIDVDYVDRSVDYCFGYNGNNFTMKNTAIQGFTGYNLAHTDRHDSRAIVYGLGEGGLLFENCLFEGQANNLWLGGGGGGWPYPDWQGTISDATGTTGTLSNVDNLEDGMLFGVFVQGLNDLDWTLGSDPDGVAPTTLISGWAVGKVESITGFDVTYEQLTSGANFRNWRIKFGTGVMGGTFTLTYRGQTTGAITFPAALTIASANTASPTEVTTTGAHGLTTGQRITISGMTGGVDANGADLNYYDWNITVTGSTTFTLDGSLARSASSGSGKVRNRTVLQTNLLAALEALSNLVPADIGAVNVSEEYIKSPTFGAQVQFASSVALLLPGDLTINATGLTGSGTVSGRVEPCWSEGYSNVHPDIAAADGAAIMWGGLQPIGITVRHCIIAKYPLWRAAMGQQKGFGEMKTGQDILFEGNIWHGQATGMILEVKNQSGAAPWSTLTSMTFRNNIWTDTGAPVAWAASDGAARTTPGHHLLIENNLFLNPSDAADSYFLGNSSHGGTDVQLLHNTIFNCSRMSYVVASTNYDGPEVAGFAKEHDWVIRDNFMLYLSSFFSNNNDTPTVPPYNNGDLRDGYSNFVADHNAVLNPYLVSDDQNSFFALNPNNWKHNDTIESVGWANYVANLDYTGDWRLDPSSLYAAGNAREASDGKDVGVDFDALLAGLGFNPWTGEAADSGNVVVGGRHRVTMQ